jgi:hypothetical protein
MKTKHPANSLIFPNPFSSETIITTSKNLQDACLVVYNSIGRQVKQIKNILGQTCTLNRDNLPPESAISV